MIPRSLSEIAVFEPLARAAERLGVELTLFGSAASRAVLLCAIDRPPTTIFELAEHASDIDLAHTGPPEVTERLRLEIERVVPFAQWLRWSILDKIGWQTYVNQMALNLKVPLRRVQLSTDRDINSPQREAIERALRGGIAFDWNENFEFSPRAKRDTEISAALLYLDAVVDVATLEPLGRKIRPQWDEHLTNTLWRAIEIGTRRLNGMNEQNAKIAMQRIWYRFASLIMRAPQLLQDSSLPFFTILQNAKKILVERYDTQIDALDRYPFMLSAAVKGGGFRIYPPPAELARSANGAEAEAIFKGSARRLSLGGKSYTLAAGERVLAAIPGLKVRHGLTPSEQFSGALPEEFVHISVTLDKFGKATLQDDLSAIAIGNSRNGSVILPAFSIVSKSADSIYREYSVTEDPNLREPRATIRLNFAGILEGQDCIDVFLVGRN